MRASLENGGVFISVRSQTKGLSGTLVIKANYVIFDIKVKRQRCQPD